MRPIMRKKTFSSSVAQIVCERVFHQQVYGIHRAGGHGCVAAATGCHEHGVIALGIDVDIVRRRKSLGVGADNQGCLARYGIGRSLAGGEVDNIAAGELLRANQAVKAAFFPVANREHIIRRKRGMQGRGNSPDSTRHHA